mmetsp:Transcript_7328/g.18558  ORF Transcript_7328/g.18558 Transcript_7328/m.18558 type:complete len:216 (-) Transcript_7328:62-709(-)
MWPRKAPKISRRAPGVWTRPISVLETTTITTMAVVQKARRPNRWPSKWTAPSPARKRRKNGCHNRVKNRRCSLIRPRTRPCIRRESPKPTHLVMTTTMMTLPFQSQRTTITRLTRTHLVMMMIMMMMPKMTTITTIHLTTMTTTAKQQPQRVAPRAIRLTTTKTTAFQSKQQRMEPTRLTTMMTRRNLCDVRPSVSKEKHLQRSLDSVHGCLVVL